jgi:hypothetical protein
VTTDKAGPYLRVIDDLVPAAAHATEQYADNRADADHDVPPPLRLATAFTELAQAM